MSEIEKKKVAIKKGFLKTKTVDRLLTGVTRERCFRLVQVDWTGVTSELN